MSLLLFLLACGSEAPGSRPTAPASSGVTSSTGSTSSTTTPCDTLTVVEGGVSVNHPSELEPLRCVREITGSLLLGRALDTAIAVGGLENVDGLESLERIGGDLWIAENDTLFDVNGLRNLQSIGGDLLVEDSDYLTTLGLTGLTHVGGSVDLRRNDWLENVDGLAQLTTVGGMLSFGGNDRLDDVSGLASLETVGGHLYVELGDSDLATFSKLTEVGGTLQIAGARETDLSALANLRSVGWLMVSGYPNLVSLDGLEGLTTIGENLALTDNPNLADIDALAGVNAVPGLLWVHGNSSLCQSLVDELEARVQPGPGSDTEPNDPGC